MRILTAVVMALALGMPLLAEDVKPPVDPPPTPPPVDGSKPPSEEEVRLKMVEPAAKEKADLLKKRMEAAKTDSERAAAISETCGGTTNVQHPIIATAVLPYLNPRQIKAGLTYGAAVNAAAITILKQQPFDETYYGVMKFIDQNRTNLAYVQSLLPIFGETKCAKAVSELAEMMRDKRDGRIALCRTAAEQLGAIGHRDAISPLISELEEEDKAGPGDVKMKDRRSQMNVPVLAALGRITGQEFKLGSQYRQWWIKNAETFQKEKKVPPPDSGGGDTPK